MFIFDAGCGAADTHREREHQQKNDGAKHAAPQFGVAGQDVLQPGEERCAPDRSAQRLDAAQHHHYQAIHRTLDAKRFRRDRTLRERVKRAGDAGGDPGDGECRPLRCAHVDAGGFGAQRRIAGRAQRIPKRGVDGPPQKKYSRGAEHQRQEVVRRFRRQPGSGPYADQAVRAPGQRVPLEHRGPGDLREGERQHRRIDARQPHAEPAEHQRCAGSGERRQCQCELHRKFLPQEEDSGGVGANSEIGGVAEGMHAARPHDEMQADGEQGKAKDVGQQDGDVAVGQQGYGEQQRQPITDEMQRGPHRQPQRYQREGGDRDFDDAASVAWLAIAGEHLRPLS